MAGDVLRLPKWAQEHIKTLARERDTAVRVMRETLDRQTPSPFSSWGFESTGEADKGPSEVVRYFQCGNSMEIRHGGIKVRVVLRGETIEMSYGHENRSGDAVVMQPRTFQQFWLFLPEDA